MPPSEMALLLLRKASQDEFAVRKLMDDPDAPDEIIGFHAQQAVEKLFKAVLTASGVPYRKTHSLLELIDAILDHGLPMPKELEAVRILTPFAVEFRYDEFLPDASSVLDRKTVVRYIEQVRQWVESQLV